MNTTIPTTRIPPEAPPEQAEAVLLAYSTTPEEARIQADARLQGGAAGTLGARDA